MKKKIGLGLLTLLVAAGAIAYATSGSTGDSKSCPSRPGCICTDKATEKVTSASVASDDKAACCDMTGCVCK